jgi:hypothetical protein
MCCRDPPLLGSGLSVRRRVGWGRHQVAPRFRRSSACGPVSPPLRLSSNFSLSTARRRMCQHVPSASVAMPPLFIALSVVFFGAIFAFLNCSRPSSEPVLSSMQLARGRSLQPPGRQAGLGALNGRRLRPCRPISQPGDGKIARPHVPADPARGGERSDRVGGVAYWIDLRAEQRGPGRVGM